ncbi:hypothetical protein ACW4FQ_29770, partial [Escherichia coli]
RATNLAGCDTTMLDTVSIKVLALPSIISINAGRLSCFGSSDDTITISGTSSNGALHFSIDSGITFSNTTGIFPGLAAGSHFVYVKDDSACITRYPSNPVNVVSPADI